jgi:hypothetical protein
MSQATQSGKRTRHTHTHKSTKQDLKMRRGLHSLHVQGIALRSYKYKAKK